MRLVDRIKKDLEGNRQVSWTGSNSDSEKAFAQIVDQAGGVVAKIGCPDVGVFGKDGGLKAVVEIKPDRGRRFPHSNQLPMLVAFAAAGLPAFVWSQSQVVRIDKDRNVHEATLDEILGLL